MCRTHSSSLSSGGGTACIAKQKHNDRNKRVTEERSETEPWTAATLTRVLSTEDVYDELIRGNDD
jgi:hypothetical protein